MPKKKIVDEGPQVVEVHAEQPLLAQVLHHARQLPPRARAVYVTEVCRTCGDVIALTPMTTWMGHVVTTLERLDAAAGEEHALTFTRELKHLLPVLAIRAEEGSWCWIKR